MLNFSFWRRKNLLENLLTIYFGKDVLFVGINGAFIPTDEQMVKDFTKNYLKFKDTTLVGDPN